MIDSPTLALENREVSLFQSLAGSRQPCLILYSGTEAGKRFDLEDGDLVVGRAPEAAVRIEALGISRRHAALRVRAESVEICDLGSANLSYVNDTQVTSAVALSDGDLVRLANVVLRFHDRRSLDSVLHDRIYRLATVDIGTNVYNRRYLQEAAHGALARARREGHPLAMICLDMDGFKSVNDRYGHPAGDQVLRESAALVQAELRASDVLGRWGGEEFAVLLRETDAAHAAAVAERLRAAIDNHVFELELNSDDPAALPRRVQHHQTVSLGVAALDDSMSDEFDLIGAADRMLYAAKRAGRNRVVGAGGEQPRS